MFLIYSRTRDCSRYQTRIRHGRREWHAILTARLRINIFLKAFLELKMAFPNQKLKIYQFIYKPNE